MQTQEFIFEKYGKCTLSAAASRDLDFCNSTFAAIMYCKKQQKHSGQQCSWSINLLFGGILLILGGGDAIATSWAVKKSSLCFSK